MVRNAPQHEFRPVWCIGCFRCEMFVPRSRVRIFSNKRSRSTPLHPKLLFGAFRTISVHLGPLVCITKLGTKHSELVQKFVPWSCVESFHNERTRSTPLDPKLMFWFVLYHFGAFGTIWLPYESRCKTGRTSAKVCAMKSRHNFSQQTHPIDLVGT